MCDNCYPAEGHLGSLLTALRDFFNPPNHVPFVTLGLHHGFSYTMDFIALRTATMIKQFLIEKNNETFHDGML